MTAVEGLPDPRRQPTLGASEVAAILGIGERAARQAMTRGELPCLRIGRYLRCPTAALVRLLDSGSRDSEAGGAPTPPAIATSDSSRAYGARRRDQR